MVTQATKRNSSWEVQIGGGIEQGGGRFDIRELQVITQLIYTVPLYHHITPTVTASSYRRANDSSPTSLWHGLMRACLNGILDKSG